MPWFEPTEVEAGGMHNLSFPWGWGGWGGGFLVVTDKRVLSVIVVRLCQPSLISTLLGLSLPSPPPPSINHSSDAAHASAGTRS